MMKAKERKRILKASRETTSHLIGNPNKITANFSSETEGKEAVEQ